MRHSWPKKYKANKILFIVASLFFICCLARIDRIFFKRNNGFSLSFLYSSLSPRAEWDLPPPTPEQKILLNEVAKQKFHYLAKGSHCYAFVSEDQNYVIKFHRYASHMRLFPWLTHPFSYHFEQRRKKIKEHNFQRLRANFTSYQSSYRNLKEETGLILLHINPTEHLHVTATLVDKTQAEYKVPLDEVTFILQHRATLIYPTLDKLLSESNLEEAKSVVSHVIELMLSCCKKGYVDKDPILRKNYGLLKDRAIHIDVGDLVLQEGISLKENYIPHIKGMTEDLHKRLESLYPALLDHYYQEIDKLSSTRIGS
jgi:hypothetical protein